MAVTRTMLKGMGLNEEQIETIIAAHTETVDGLKAYKADAERLKAVQQELDDLKARGDGGYKAKYDKEHKDFEDYKADVAAKAAKAEKEALYRAALKEAGVDEKRFDAILRATDLSAVAVKDGKLEDKKAVVGDIKRDWADFIPKTTVDGTPTETPPVNNGSGPSRESILSIKDTAARQKAMAEHHELFGI